MRSDVRVPPCQLRVWVYTSLPALDERVCGYPTPPAQSHLFSSSSNRRAFTSELAVYCTLLRACRRVASAQSADLLLVPALLGGAIASGWTGSRGARNDRDGRMLHWLRRLHGREAMNATLPYLSAGIEAARRHVFLCSVDSEFVPLHGSSVGPEQHAIWMHLGDDAWTGKPRGARGVHMPNGLTLPYRISHWLPFGFPPRPPRPVARSLLLFGTINPTKHGTRRRLLASLRNQTLASAGLAREVLLHESATMLTAVSAAGAALRARFCLCPTGDSKGFTARLYFSIAHGCIPVRVDGFRRPLSWPELAFPFPSLIDWRRVVIDVPLSDAHRLLQQLKDMPRAEVDARLGYIQSIGHWLIFDREHGQPGAADAMVRELESRLLTHRRVPLGVWMESYGP